MGDKDKLTAAAEAQASTGHDIIFHRDWMIRTYAQALEPLDDIVAELINQYGPISPVFEYLGQIKGTWRAVPATRLMVVKPCCSRLDLYKEHAGIDLRDIFPADEAKHDKAKIATWTWDAYLTAAERLFRVGYPVGLPMGQTSDSVDWVAALFNSYGVVMVDAKDNIKINSDETRVALEYLKKLMAVNPPDVYAWDDAGNNRWLISGKGAGIMNPPSAWAVAKRQPESGGELLDTPDAERPEGPVRRAASNLLRIVEFFEEQAGSEGTAALSLAKSIGRETGGSVVWL
jgi:Bacterial extracellular solute-binding protein